MFFDILTLYGSWEILDSLNILIGGAPTISTPGKTHSENYFFDAFFDPQPNTHFSNSAAKNAHVMALIPSPTHPERCATKFRARRRQKFLKIFHLVPDREKNVVRKCPPNRVSIAKCEIGSIHKSEAPSIHKSDHKSEDPSIAKSEAPYIHIHTRINRYPHTLVRGDFLDFRLPSGPTDFSYR